jgi:Chitin binding Peritrophin-A domain
VEGDQIIMNLYFFHLVGALCLSSVAGLEQGFGLIFPDAKAVDVCAGKPDGFFVNDLSSCGAYFSCKDGIGVPLKCPNGLYFDEAKQACNYPDQVSCVSCPPEGIHTQPDLFNCTRFVLCYGGVQIPMECAPGLRFDPTTGQCGLAANVPCPIRCPPGIQAPGDILFFPSEVDCASYAICYNGTAVEFRCPYNTHFNRETNQCDTVENANCTVSY